MAVPEKQDIVESGLDYLIKFWEDKPVARGILTSQLKELQKLEDVVYKLLTERGIYSAIGKQLDVLGTLVGEGRQGRDDEPYRVAILNRLAINKSDGTIPVVLDIIKSLSGTENPTLFEHYPALVISKVSQQHTHKLAKINDEIMAAGVLGLLAYNYDNTSFVGAELESQDELYITNDDEFVTLDDGTYLAYPSFRKIWDSNRSCMAEISGFDISLLVTDEDYVIELEDGVYLEEETGIVKSDSDFQYPLAELFDKRQYNIERGSYITNDNTFVELNDGSILVWQTAEEFNGS